MKTEDINATTGAATPERDAAQLAKAAQAAAKNAAKTKAAQAAAGGAAAKEPESNDPPVTATEVRDARESGFVTPKQYRAKVLCFDGKLYKAGETRFSAKELDPAVWEAI